MRLPAVLPALALVAGAAAGTALPAASPWPAVGVMLCAVALAAATLRRPGIGFYLCVVAGFGAAGTALGADAVAHAVAPDLRRLDRALQADAPVPPVRFEGRLVEDAAPTQWGAGLLVAPSATAVGGSWHHVEGGIRVSVGGSLVDQARASWRAGRLVRLTAAVRAPTGFRNPGARDESTAFARRGITLVGSVKSAALVEVVAPGHAAAEAAAAVRAWVRTILNRRIGPRSPQSAAIVTAILIGDRAGLDDDVERRLQEAGTYHVIAISGGNIAVLAGLALAIGRLTRAPGRSGPIAAIVALAAYGYIAGGGPSVGRATLAAVLYLAARALDHRAPSANTLAVASAVAVLRSPLDLYDPGLGLSYGATLALIMGAETGSQYVFRRHPRAPRAARAVVGLAVATICAEIAVLPLSALAFGRITTAGLVLNFAAVPLMAIVQTAGLAVLALDSLAPPISTLAALIADLCATGVVSSTSLLDVAPWLTWRVPAPPIGLLVVYYAACGLALTAVRAQRAAIAVAACAGVAIATPHLAPTRHLAPASHQALGTRHPALEVTVLDVGQGESILVALPDGRCLLVDAGGSPTGSFDVGGRVVAPAITTLGVRRLAAFALTHPDPDHIGGAPTILRDFRPIEIWEGVPVPPHPARRALAIQAARRGTGWRTLQAGHHLRFGLAEIAVLHPPPPDWERQRARNDDSLVLDVRLGRVSILLTGDVGRDVEGRLLPAIRPAAIRVLKGAHHGSGTSTGDALLRAYRPHAVIFSAGRDNRFGHPAAPVLARVAASGAQIFRTDQDGAITISTDGHTVAISTMTGRRLSLGH